LLTAAAVATGPVYCASIAANGCYAAGLRQGLLTSQLVSLLTVMAANVVGARTVGQFRRVRRHGGGRADPIACLLVLPPPLLAAISKAGASRPGREREPRLTAVGRYLTTMV